MSTAPSATDRDRAARRALGAALFGGALGAALVLVSAGQTWGEAVATGPGGALPVEVGGGDVTGVPSALALVGLAALVAVFAVRGAARLLVALTLTLCGAGAVVAALAGAVDTGALSDAAATATGLSGGSLRDVSHSAWPYVAAAGGALLVLVGLLALRHGRRWPAMGSRYERGSGARRPRPGPGADADRPEDLWKALDRGEDPTDGPGDGATDDPGDDPGDGAGDRPAADGTAGDDRPKGP
ncbi:hypothetical protein GCM10023347_21040 [Streptomyces chumphonensis]|uniref:TIGR02234 family membrane protein n=1 Tax=Streptomyces chumphonensis TaxID=1214925 RepID=A0A927EVF4_9ACTN|nr:TIGR02234 family membrane protein [Streptomyces chumphonensis]MBD3930191.1 TIGR02234 family membrane protein [Streptomyces chumphonensis]